MDAPEGSLQGGALEPDGRKKLCVQDGAADGGPDPVSLEPSTARLTPVPSASHLQATRQVSKKRSAMAKTHVGNLEIKHLYFQICFPLMSKQVCTHDPSLHCKI